MSSSKLVNAAGMFLNFVSVLQEELDKAGGNPWMLYFSQKEHARPMMALLAKTIVESGLWRVPKSAILAEIPQDRDQDKRYLEEDLKHHWTTYSKLAKSLTTLHFANDPAGYGNEPIQGIPDVGPYEKCGDIVQLEDRKYVVTYCGSEGDGLFLAPAEWIDLDS